MLGSELVQIVASRLPKRYKNLSPFERQRLVDTVLKLAYATIMEATSMGEDVRIANFAQFRARYYSSDKATYGIVRQRGRRSKSFIRVRLKVSKAWKRMLRKE